MANEASVTAVTEAIRSVYLGRQVRKRATAREIIEASGLGQKTYYRVMTDHPEVAQMLTEYETLFLNGPSPEPDRAVESDPVKRDPEGALKEALAVIAYLTDVTHQQHKRIQDLERSVDALVDDEMSGRRPDTPSISAARKRWRDGQAAVVDVTDRAPAD